MEILHKVLQEAIRLGATDIHLATNQIPVYRKRKKLLFD